MQASGIETIALLKELRELTANGEGAQRVAWTDTWLKARRWFASKLEGLPVEHHHDAAGNHWVTLPGRSKKCLILGGHLDSVPNGGWLDGALGVLASFAVMRRVIHEYEGRPPVTVRLVDWADEEGARFGRSLFGSSAFAGTASIEADRSRLDSNGVQLEDALKKCGVDIDSIGEAAEERTEAAAYLELHIEQGPVLERLSLPLAVVLGTKGVERYAVTFRGAGNTFRIDTDGRATRCPRAGRQAGTGNSGDRRKTSRRGLHDGQRQNLSGHCDSCCRAM